LSLRDCFLNRAGSIESSRRTELGWGRGFESPRPLQSNQWLSRLGREIPSCSSAEFPRNLFGGRSPLQLAIGELDAREGLAILDVPDKSAACLLSSSIRNSLPQSITLRSSHKHQL
jgi:hypothetical protein